MGDIGDIRGSGIGEVAETLCLHFDRVSPDVPCPRCGMPADKQRFARVGGPYGRVRDADCFDEVLREIDEASNVIGYDGEFSNTLGAARTPGPISSKLVAMSKMTLLGRQVSHESSPELTLSNDHKYMAISREREILEGLVALSSPAVTLAPGQHRQIVIESQLPLYGPFRVGIACSSNQGLRVRDLRIGNQMLTAAVGGEMPAEHLHSEEGVEWPRGLVPVHGPAITCGSSFIVNLYNDTCITQDVTVTVWAHPQPLAMKMRHVQGEPGGAPDHFLMVTNTGDSEITLYHEKVATQLRKQHKHLSERIGVLSRELSQEQTKTAASRRRAEAADRRLAQSKLQWFGQHWHAPVCMAENRAASPRDWEGKTCHGCGCIIIAGQSGFLVPPSHTDFVSPPAPAATPVVYHRMCWYVEIGAVEPPPGSRLAVVEAARQKLSNAMAARTRDSMASFIHSQKPAVDDDDGWNAWSSATDEDP